VKSPNNWSSRRWPKALEGLRQKCREARHGGDQWGELLGELIGAMFEGLNIRDHFTSLHCFFLSFRSLFQVVGVSHS